VAITVGVPTETHPGERRVAVTPKACDALKKLGATVLVEHGAGEAAGFPDSQFEARGAQVASRETIFRESQILAMVRTLGANPKAGLGDLGLLRPGHILIGFGEPLTALQEAQELAERGVTCFAMELVPRITRAQSMDALSSMATIAGYRAVLLAAVQLPKMFPMLMTAAGTITPAKVFILGAGVAGLQAIATAKRLGAVASGYDVRAAVKEQVESVGGKFVVLDVGGGNAEGSGGYAKAMDEEFYRKQREAMTNVIREMDVVITTAAVPGKKAPILVTGPMVEAMAPGSVVVDIAAERGGNCELTRPGETVRHQGVTIMGPLNLPSTIPYDASLMYSANVASFLKLLVKDGALTLNREDEIIRESMVCHEGQIVNGRINELLSPQLAGPKEAKA
jgi:H+-translocating NAD(P) transhydrogenase subunit alpha